MRREQVLPKVMADMAARIAKGADEYGEPLTTHNGRKPLQDAYEEALDLALYLKQELLERVVSDALHDGLGVLRFNGDGSVDHVPQEEFRAPGWPGPDWAQAPEWAVWWVAYSDGVGLWACWHRHEPVQGLYGWDDNGAPGESSRAMQASIFGYTGDWRDSLRKRPEAPKCSHAMFFATAKCPDCDMRADQIRQQQQGK